MTPSPHARIRSRRASPLPLLFAVCWLPGVSHAANPDIVVSKFTDSFDGVCNVDCSLREAVQFASQTPGADRIVLAAGTYALTILPPEDPDGFERNIDADDNRDGDLDVGSEVSIVGRGADRTAITTGGIDRILEVLPGGKVTLSKLAIVGGRVPYGGGGLSVNAGASLVVQLGAVSSNLAAAAFSGTPGGGIYNAGALTLSSTRIDGNRSAAGEGSFGTGGGVYNIGSLTVRDSSFIANRASDDDDAGLGGGIFNSGSADIRRSSFERNQVSYNGSGASLLNAGAGNLLLDNSTVSGSDLGFDGFTTGAVENGGRFDSGLPVARLVNVTIAGNTVRGLINRGDITVINSIIAGNGMPEDPEYGDPAIDRNCASDGTAARFVQRGLLRGSDDGNCPTTLLVLNADSFRTVLWPLAANNNEFLPTFSLRKVSIAIDAAVGNCATQDQRGAQRPRDGNGDGIAACDLGAYERPRP